MSETVAPGRARRTLPNGVWGMLIFVLTEGTLFGSLLGTYFYLRFNSPQWPPDGIEAPSVALPLALTGALVLSAVPVVLAALAAHRGRRGAAMALVSAALVVQGGYLAWQIVSFLHDLDSFSPSATAYGSIYFTLLAADHLHVALGILFSLWVVVRLAVGLNPYRLVTVQAVALYWVVVALLTVLVTLTQVSPS
ncbi:MAG TPA: cytochrome c oxidase subunit 3 [Solirubrobacteraceae bacterium]|nr:cytochrome c oxidase subunit 3 [Solirubrobacteraceae bacterium]